MLGWRPGTRFALARRKYQPRRFVRLVSLRLQNVELFPDAEANRIGQRRVEIIIAASVDGIGRDRRPLAQDLSRICARQQMKGPAELAGRCEL